jgi:hypothetical protein
MPAAPEHDFIPILNQSAIFVGSEARRMPGSLSASLTYVQRVTFRLYASSPSPSHLNIIFDLEMVLYFLKYLNIAIKAAVDKYTHINR